MAKIKRIKGQTINYKTLNNSYTNPHKTKVNSCAPSVAPVMLPAENPVISKKKEKEGGCNIVKIKHTKNVTTFFFDLSNIGGPSAPSSEFFNSSDTNCIAAIHSSLSS
jgi:hypothetical protein